MNFSNDKEFFTHEFQEESSSFDPKSSFLYGPDCYFSTFRCRIPITIKDNDEKIEEFINNNLDTEGFWV